jgi:3-phenylpropionate/trans-cinnamate dioxygenase ferredoxin reductase component
MPSYTYLIVGSQMTAAAAIQGIREVDREGAIGLIGAEPHPPYNRPPLSKGLWKGDPPDSVWRRTKSQGVSFHLGRTARTLDPRTKQVTDDQGTSYTYSKLLLATGCTPRRLPFGGEEGEQVIYFRTLDDYQRLRSLADKGRRFVAIGGGFIGSELAAALAMNGKQVVLVFPDESIGGRMYPPELATFLNSYYRDKGVEVLAKAKVTGYELRDGTSVLRVRDDQANEREILADGVVAGIGVQPNVELAQAAGLTIDNGIRVDASLRTSDPDIYAAGDVARFHNPALDQWLRVEHEDNANTMGRLAGQSMAGRPVTYDYLPFFYSDLFDLGYEAVGEIDSRLQMVTDWKTPCREGVVYYLRDGRVRGVLLWGIFGQVDAARQLIASPGPFQPADLKGRIAG